MKPKPDFETPFEDSLAEFEHAPLPAEWKAELIDNALSEASARNVLRFPSFTKVAIGALAACWVAIFVLNVMTPDDPGSSGGQVAQKTEIPEGSLPLLVQYFESRRSLNSNF